MEAAVLSWLCTVHVFCKEKRQTDVESERLEQKQRFYKEMVFTLIQLTYAE